jgi:uncharacterized protein YegL
MTDREYVHYIMITDRSGSMQSVRADTEGGIRAFIDRQLEGVDADKRTVSFYQFDTVHDRLWDFAPLAKARNYKLEPRGGTALLDACGQAITEVGARLAAMPEHQRPGYVMVIIATDGQENSSKEYTRAQVREMIAHQQDRYDWRFTYIGANQDAFAEAASIGISSMSALNYSADSFGTRGAWTSVAFAASSATHPTSAGIYYTSEQRETAVSK